MSEEIRTVLELIQWPAVVAAIGIVALFVFRAPLSDLIARIRRVKGFDFSDPPEQNVQATSSLEASQELMRAWDNQLLVEQETLIREYLEQSGMTEPTEREKVLIRLTAAVSLQAMMERIYNEILGSQIDLLRVANQHANGISKVSTEARFEVARTTWPVETYTIDNWIAYLVNNLLLLEGTGGWCITVRGREFLKYLLDQGLADKSF